MDGQVVVVDVLYWFMERTRDLLLWPINLVRDMPGRASRLLSALSPHERGWRWWLHTFFCAIFDLIGGPEIAQFFMHLGMYTTPLSQAEITAVSSVLGSRAIRWGEVRIAEGGILKLVFRYNGNRAFATWHTVHFPGTGKRARSNLSLLVHELTHVYQYETVGTRYIGEAVAAQMAMGAACYDYGGPAGLFNAHYAKKLYCQFNREAQAQIAQDFYARREAGNDVSDYQSFIAELQQSAF